MPPSPVARISPRRELRAENHKRGRSLEGGILFRDKEDDLALFNEVQNKEKENFLLQSNDDFDIFSTKLRHFSGNNLGVTIPARGESSDILNAEGDKNDYDWLITPPETPLFRSLDDKAPLASHVPRGRPRSQPITISRSSTMEKGHRSARSSASPHRLSPSSPSNNMLQSRSRPFSATRSSPPPSRRLSPSPSKPTPAPRTSTPTLPRRMSTGSASSQSRARAPSPVKTTRGNSASPKTRSLESNINIPGFSLETPPNLRTSLADRPGSYVRGSSPASRNGFRSGRQSMSPTATRSVSSCHSQERDQFSTHSKGSIVSSGDDDVDSLQSNPVSGECSFPRSVGAYSNSRTMGFSKKANKVLSSSVPKRSFDLAPRPMEKKAPQNMFRPLLSSVPSTTLYAGKEIAHHRSLASRNSSITTSSNASSDLGTSGAFDTEESEKTREDVTSDIAKGQYPILHDEIFVMDQIDAIESRIIGKSPGSAHGENDETSIAVSDVVLDRDRDTDGTVDMESCSKCRRSFNLVKLIREGDIWLCLECKNTEINLTRIVPVNSVRVDNNTTGDIVQIPDCESSQLASCCGTVKDHLYSIEDLDMSSTEEKEPVIATQSVGPSGVCSNIDLSEGRGISLLLKRSSSGKAHIVQSKSFTASNVSYDDFSYTRESVNSMSSSIGHSSASMSSSFDLGSSRQTEKRIHRQSSSLKSEMESYRQETPVKHRPSLSSLSGGASCHVFSKPSCLGDNLEVPAVKKEKEIEPSLACEFTDAESICIDIESSVMFKSAVDCSEELAPHDLASISGHSVNEEISAEISIRGDDDVMQTSCVEKVDVSEVPRTSSWDAVSEIEVKNDGIASVDPNSDVDSMVSKDELTERSYSLPRNEVMEEESGISVPVNGVLEESVGTRPGSFTLEEATLFCRSIVHNLAYEAANMAIDKDNSPMEVLLPAPTFVGKSNLDRRDMRLRAAGRRVSKSQKTRQGKLDEDTKPPIVAGESDEKTGQDIVKTPSKGDSTNPPKVESKCNCTIM